jgi:hypothetical protein
MHHPNDLRRNTRAVLLVQIKGAYVLGSQNATPSRVNTKKILKKAMLHKDTKMLTSFVNQRSYRANATKLGNKRDTRSLLPRVLNGDAEGTNLANHYFHHDSLLPPSHWLLHLQVNQHFV